MPKSVPRRRERNGGVIVQGESKHEEPIRVCEHDNGAEGGSS
jgi:hypothetical protein